MSREAAVYAQALYGLAKEENKDAVILQQMQAICEAVAAEPSYLELLAAHNLPKAERCAILDDSFRGKAEPYLLNYLKILTEQGYIRHLSAHYGAYRDIYNRDHGIVPVRAVTAVPMTDEQLEKLTGKLQAITGKTVALENVTDPAVLGGVRLDYDGKRVDGTVQNRLDTISKMLKNTVL